MTVRCTKPASLKLNVALVVTIVAAIFTFSWTISNMPAMAAAPPSLRSTFATTAAFDAMDGLHGNRYVYTDNWAGDLAWGASYVMEAYVTMYEATGETKYLDRLVYLADAVLAHRDSILGTTDYLGRSLPGWTAGAHYSIGEIELLDAGGHPILYLSTAATGYNHQTQVVVTAGQTPDTFNLRINNAELGWSDYFTDLTMDPEHPRYAVKVISASPLAAPTHAARLKVRDLNSPSQGEKRHPVPVYTTLSASRYLWPVHQGMITYPMIAFARLVQADPKLEAYKPKAAAYIQAVEELMEILEADWRENEAGEGWYAVPRGAPVWMDGIDEPFNHFLAVGRTMVELAAVTGKTKWRERAEKMARTFKNDLRLAPLALKDEGEVLLYKDFEAEDPEISGDVVLDTTTAAASQGSLLIVDNDPTRYAAVRIADIPVEPGITYSLSVWCKTDDPIGDGGYITILVDELSAAKSRVQVQWFNQKRSLDWEHNRIEIIPAPQTAFLRLTIYPAARTGVQKMGQAWFDDLTLMAQKGDAESVETYIWPYWWSKGYGYKGWTQSDDVSDNTPALSGRTTIEDTSHGSIDAHFAYLAYKNGMVFDDTDMMRFANTFLYRMVSWSNGKASLKEFVNGTGETSLYDQSAARWGFLAEFNPEIYNVLESIYGETSWSGYSLHLLASAVMNRLQSVLFDE